MRNVPTLTRIECLAATSPLCGAWVTVSLPMKSKNTYHLLFGPSDEEGLIHFSGHDLIEAARREHELALMDYASFPGEWTGEMAVQPLRLDDIASICSAMEVWGESAYPSELAARLAAYEAQLRAIGEENLAIRLGPAAAD